MAAPKSLVGQLHRHWEAIETLCRRAREQPAFEREQALAAIRRHLPADAPESEAFAALRSLCAADILIPLSRSEDLQINPLVLEFVRGLTREHALGLSEVLKARVEAVREATARLEEGMEENDSARMREAAAALAELFRKIGMQLDQDRHAILELAERAKAADASMPLARRYRTVLEAYDRYVEPMNEMMDSGLGGSFYPHLEAAERALDAAVERLSTRGALYTHRLQLRQVAYQAKELRRLGRIVARQCADTLLPLREELRRNSRLTAAVSELLGRVRKRGLRRALPARTQATRLPLWRIERRVRLPLGGAVREYMAAALRYVPREQPFPEEIQSAADALPPAVDEQALHAALRAALPVPDLMRWLRAQYPALPDARLLQLYHEVVNDERWQASLQPQRTHTELQRVRVFYHPHAITACRKEDHAS